MDASIRRVADYVNTLAFPEIPRAAVHEARRRVIDSVACAAGAGGEPFIGKLQAMAARGVSDPPARLWGSGQPVSVEMAAFVNGTMLRYLDFSDTVLALSNGHPSDMLGGLIGAAEAYRRNGASLISAIVVAYEVYCSLCGSVPMAARGIDQGTAAAVGTAAGIARLLDFSADQTANALSLALASNLHLYNVRCGELSDWKGCGGPNGARNGVFAAMLAREGISGPTAPVEGKGGLFEVLGGFEWKIGAGGDPWIARTHLKLHPVCYHGQSAVDAALALRRQADIRELRSIEIETYEAAYLAMGKDPQRWAPGTRETADHSLPYVVVTAWQEGKLSSCAYEDSRLRCSATRELMRLVSVRAVPELTAEFPRNAAARIRARLRDGSELEHLQRNPKGNAENPLSDIELETKFVDLFGPWRGKTLALEALDALWSIDTVDDVSRVVDKLCRQ